MIKKNNIILFFILNFSFLISYAAESNQFFLLNYLGKPQINRIENQEPIKLSKKTTLNESVKIVTGVDELIELQVREKFKFIVFPQSEVLIEGFQDENTKEFEVKTIEMLSGRFYVQNFSIKPITFESVFFKWEHSDLQKYEEFFVDLDKVQALLKICAGETGLKVNLFDLEETKSLTREKGAQYQGVVEKNEVAFDYLLKGRKIPKGQWKEDFTCDFKNILSQVNDIQKNRETKNKSVLQNKKNLELKKQKEYSLSLCHEPNGQFNDCYWRAEYNKCYRYRCNAEGKWTDQFLVSPKDVKTYCSNKVIVKKCNY